MDADDKGMLQFCEHRYLVISLLVYVVFLFEVGFGFLECILDASVDIFNKPSVPESAFAKQVLEPVTIHHSFCRFHYYLK